MGRGGLADNDVRRMRAGVAARITELAHRVGVGLQRGSPTAMAALLCSSALAPVVAAGAASAVVVASAGVVGSVGANVLAGVVDDMVDRLRANGGRDGISTEGVERELASVIEERLGVGGETARELRQDIAVVLGEIGAAEVALEAAVASGNAAIRDQVTEAFKTLGVEFAEFRGLLVEASAAIEIIQDRLRQEDAARRSGLELSRQTLTQVRLLRDDLGSALRRISTDRSVGLLGEVGSGWADRCPYRGLAPFMEEHGEVFFGRERVTAELVSRLAERLEPPSVVVVTGASGAGKSSLLRAGLLPALTRGMLGVVGSADWPRLSFTPTATPLDELATYLAVLGGVDPVGVRRELAEHPDQAHLLVRKVVLAHQRTVATTVASGRSATASPDDQVGEGRLVLVVDQFEQVFALDQHGDNGAGQADAFVTALMAAASTPCGPTGQPPAVVVLGVRGDYWDRCAAHPQLSAVLQDGQFLVGSMSEWELRQTITGPATAAGLEIEDGLTDAILNELRSGSTDDVFGVTALPLVSQAMLVTWRNRDGHRLTSRGYGASGGVRRAVQVSAEAAFDQLNPAQKDAAREIFTRLTVVTRDNAFARRPLGLSDLTADNSHSRRDVEVVVGAFTDKRLLVRDVGVVEIAHDTLLDAWSRLREWLVSDRDALSRHSDLMDRARTWRDRGRDPSYLYRGTELAAVQQLVDRWKADPDRYPALDEPSRNFLAASISSDKRRRYRARTAITALAILLVVALLAAGAAVNSANSAERSADSADQQHRLVVSRQLVAQSDAITESDPRASMLLAAQAWEFARTPEAHHRMLDALALPGRDVLTGHSDSVDEVVYSPDGKTLASTSTDGTVRLWDTGTHRDIRQLAAEQPDGSTRRIKTVAFSPDGTTLASVDGAVRLWDLTTGAQIGEPFAGDYGFGQDTAVSVAFGPQANILATGHTDGTVRLWDLATRRQIEQLTEDQSDIWVTSIMFSPDGTTLAAATNNGTVQAWDMASYTPLAEPFAYEPGTGGESGDYSATTLAFGPDGARLATGDFNGTIRIWSPATQTPLGEPLEGHTGIVNAVAFSPDGTTLASGGDDGTVRLWDVVTGSQLGEALEGHTGIVNAVAFSPDGTTLASGSADRSVRLWDPRVRRQASQPLTGLTGPAWLSPDGTTAATSNAAIQLWDVATHRQIGQLAADPAPQPVAFSLDGALLASANWDDEDGVVRLWDVTDQREIGQIPTGQDIVWAMAFSPDGAVFASDGAPLGDAGATVRLWDVASGRPIGEPLEAQTASVNTLAFSPDGAILASGGDDGKVRLWDMANRRPIGQALEAHTAPVNTVAFSPDGTVLASAGAEGTMRLWDTTTHRQLGQPLATPSGQVSALAFSPDGTILASAETGGHGSPAGGAVRLWDVATHQQIGETLSSQDPMTLGGIAYSADGSTLAISSDTTVRVWDVATPTDPAPAICDETVTPLSREEWNTYLESESFEPLCD